MDQQPDVVHSPNDDQDMESASITRDDIMSFPFPHKLWIIIHQDLCDFIAWNLDGTIVLFELSKLQDYLDSTRSIFKIKNSYIFFYRLHEFKFERIPAMDEAKDHLFLQYRNENFQRYRIDLLCNIRRQNGLNQTEFIRQEIEKSLERLQGYANRISDRMFDDLCAIGHGTLSNVNRNRLNFHSILMFQNENRLLHMKLQAAVDFVLKPRQYMTDGTSPLLAEEQAVELPINSFENPYESVLHLGENFKPDYAGYYGNCTKQQLTDFFGDYLPVYEEGSMEVKKVDVPVGSTNFKSMEEDVSDADDKDSDICTNNILTSQNNIPAANSSAKFVSTLEPIFKQGDDDIDLPMSTTSSQSARTDDIELKRAMDEFIKFNDTKTDEDHLKTLSFFSGNSSDAPSAPKTENTDEEDSENEANFRNFFSHYRESLNLIYERH